MKVLGPLSEIIEYFSVDQIYLKDFQVFLFINTFIESF